MYIDKILISNIRILILSEHFHTLSRILYKSNYRFLRLPQTSLAAEKAQILFLRHSIFIWAMHFDTDISLGRKASVSPIRYNKPNIGGDGWYWQSEVNYPQQQQQKKKKKKKKKYQGAQIPKKQIPHPSRHRILGVAGSVLLVIPPEKAQRTL